MRCLFGFLCVCALGAMPLVGCSETTGDGGNGGDAGSGGTAGSGGSGGTGGTFEPGWGDPERIGDGYDPDLAVNASGTAMAVWFYFDGTNVQVWAAVFTLADGWKTPEVVAAKDGYASYPQIAIDPSGKAIAVWQQDRDQQYRAWSAAYTPSGGWQTPEALDPDFIGDTHTPSVAMDAGGNAIAAWVRTTGPSSNIVAAHYTPTGGWGVIQRIDSDEVPYSGAPRVAVDPAGNAIAVCAGDDGEFGSVFANRFTLRDGWGSFENIDNRTRGGIGGHQVAVDAEGNAIAVWRQDNEEGGGSRIWFNRFTPTNGWQAMPSQIESDNPADSRAPAISMNATGTAVVVWQRWDYQNEQGGIWSVHFDPDAGWGSEVPVETDYVSEREASADVAIDPKANALAVWRGEVNYRSTIWSSGYSPSNGWDRSVRLDIGGEVSNPRVGMDGAGKGLAVWPPDTGGLGATVWASRYGDGPWTDHSEIWQALCDASCGRSLVCFPDDESLAECISECMADLERMPCQPNPGALDICVEELESWDCGSIEVGWLPYACEAACVGDLLCERRTCDDQNDCTEDRCEPADGSCEYTDLPDGASCADGEGTCHSGVCAAEFACTEQGIRDAIAFGGGPHTFACNGPTTVTTETEIMVDNGVILDGEDELTIDANHEQRVLSVSVSGLEPDGTPKQAELRRMVVSGGLAKQGGGIYNSGTLTLIDATVSGNEAKDIYPEADGGGIFNRGTLALIRSNVSGNTVSRSVSYAGGGIHNLGTLTLTDSVVSGNTAGDGGGISTEGETTLIRSLVFGNDAIFGGGLHIEEGVLTLAESSVSENTSGGGISALGGTVALTRTTVSNNESNGNGGGMASHGNARISLTNSTISGNTSSTLGGGIDHSGAALTVTSSTIADNTAFEFDAIHGWPVKWTNSVIQGDCSSPSSESNGYNIESPGDTCGFDTNKGDQVNVSTDDLNLGALANNGGPTMTHKPGDGGLREGSVAIDQIPEADCQVSEDQRGLPRPVVIVGPESCDVGSFEVQSAP